MNILNELTIKNLKQNKKRTMVTIFGIMLSVALVTAITTFLSSMQGSLIEYAKRNIGDYHLYVTDIPAEEQKYFLKNEKIGKIMKTQTLGEITMEEVKLDEYEDSVPQMRLKAFGEDALTHTGKFLYEGRLPKNEKEVVFPMNLVWIESLQYVVGDEITFRVNGVEQTYTICGMSNYPSFEFYTDEGNMGYTFLTKLSHDAEGETSDLFITMKDPKDTYRFYEELTKKRGYAENQIEVNHNLLRFEGVTRSEATMQILYRLAFLVILIIIFTSVFVIKNSFDISITERIRQYGMLASIGATSKQIRKNVLFEGFALGIIAVPLGVLCGIFAIWVTLRGVMWILEDAGLAAEFYNLQLHISGGAVVAAVVVAVVTIFISALIPARKAAKVAPIDAIREAKDVKISGKKLRTPKLLQKLFGIEGELADKNLKRSRKKYRTTVFSIFSKDVKISGKKLRTPKLLQKLFGIEGELADKNLKRSRKKYRTTVFSIFLSVVLFVSISSMMKYAFELQDLQVRKQDFNLYAWIQNVRSKELTSEAWTGKDYDRQLEIEKEAYQKVKKLEGIKRATIVKYMVANVDAAAFSERALELQQQMTEGCTREDMQEMINVKVYSVEDREYRDYLKDLGLDYEEAEGKAILLDQALYEVSVDGKPIREKYRYLDVEEGDTLSIQELTGEDWKQNEKTPLEIVKVTEEAPFGLQSGIGFGMIRVIVSEKMMEQFDHWYDGIRIDAEDTRKLAEEIEQIEQVDGGTVEWDVNDLDAEARESKSLILVVSIFVYGFIAVISVIGITNVFNTITTNMTLRSREFAILKSVGMTEKEFRKMIRYESLLYGVKALALGLPAGVLLSYLFHYLFVGILIVEYKLPWREMGIAVVFVFLIISLTMHYAVKKSQKQNIIETIRSENI